MSPSPQPVEIPNEVRDGAIAASMGVVAFVIRAICSDRAESWSALAIQTLLAGFVAVLVGLASKGWFTEALNSFHLAVAGFAGFLSPELVSKAIKSVKGFNFGGPSAKR